VDDLVTEVVDDEAGLRRLRRAWDVLHQEGAGATNPFLRWTWLWHRWRSISAQPGQPYVRLHILVMRDRQGQVRAIVPLFHGTWRVGPVTLRALREFGFHTAAVDLRAPLIWAGWERGAAQALTAALLDQRRLYDVCFLDGLPEGSTFTDELGRWALVNGWSWGPSTTAFVLHLPSSWEDLRKTLSHNNRRSVQQGLAALQRDGRQYRYEEVSDPADLSGALDEFFAVHAARAALRCGPRHSNYYARAADRACLRELAADLSKDSLIKVCRLIVDGQVAACRLVLTTGDGVYLSHAGHDPAWARYRVGTTLTAECLRSAVGAHVRCVHMGTGEDDAKVRWRPEARTLKQLRIVAPTVHGIIVGGLAQHIPKQVLRQAGVRAKV
jgi:CelD/BcsL family acetyltransferase involved in cellulose biosynthesis